MDSLHDDLFGLQDGDSSPPNCAAKNFKGPEKYRHILCSKCKSLTKPKIQDLCQACVRKIATVLAGGHASASSSESEVSSDSEPNPEPGPEAGHLIVGDRVAVSSLGSQSLDADVGVPSLPNNTSASASTWQSSTTTSTYTTTVATESGRTRTWTQTKTQTRSHSTTRAGAVCQHEHERRKRRQREAEAKAERERAEAAARAKFQAWLHERTQHRNWQKQMANYLRITYPPGSRKLTRLLASIRSCPCHDDPECSVQISLEYREHLALEEADRTYRLRDGRGIADWVPLIGGQAKKFWVEREIDYLKSQAEAGVGSNLNDGGGIEVGGLLGGQLTYRLEGRELVLGLWRMRSVLDCVWRRIPDARWGFERTSDKSNTEKRRGTIKDERTALLHCHEQARGKRAMVKLDQIRGCLLWAGERNPCWALLPLLRDGGDVGMVWRWERFVWEPSHWNPFTWAWRKLVRVSYYLLRLVKQLVRDGFRGLEAGFDDVEDGDDEEDSDLD